MHAIPAVHPYPLHTHLFHIHTDQNYSDINIHIVMTHLFSAGFAHFSQMDAPDRVFDFTGLDVLDKSQPNITANLFIIPERCSRVWNQAFSHVPSRAFPASGAFWLQEGYPAPVPRSPLYRYPVSLSAPIHHHKVHGVCSPSQYWRALQAMHRVQKHDRTTFPCDPVTK